MKERSESQIRADACPMLNVHTILRLVGIVLLQLQLATSSGHHGVSSSQEEVSSENSSIYVKCLLNVQSSTDS